MNKKELRQAALEKHYAVCAALGKHLGMKSPDGKNISTKLFAIERQAHRCAEGYCNGESCAVYALGDGRREFHFGTDENAWEDLVALVAVRVKDVFGGVLPSGFHVNGDPRGHALKLEPNSVTIDPPLSTDWGGYQILSPEIE